ncbi:MAG: hypothetical protein JSR44_05595 [Spirochaetes bacterium]|nr:hypothetical protein [Spirochaetota bacterium]
MKTKLTLTFLIACVLAPISAQNYSSYRYIASKRYGKCFKATNYNGADYSVATLTRKYNCEAQENTQIGGLILTCQMPAGSTAFVYTQSGAACESALRAMRGM